jgi:DNA-binding transcriptional ArsR family regulator
MLQHIIPSKARRKIMELFFHNINESHYLRKIVRDVDEEVNAVKRELDILSEAKVLHKEKRLNKIFYTLNRNYIYFDEFLRIYAKTMPIAAKIYKNIPKIGKAKFIAMSTKFIKKISIKEDEIYLLFVGTIVVPEIVQIIAEVEKDFGREINYTVMTEEEFNFRKKNNDPFIWRFLKQPKILLVGQEEELLK